ncbi:PepSY-associated TM helix domain-containing protein [Gracilimonas mengyeensis]|uniref:Uncharacterized iron-regulated membrane protein n=1 Tax=Gracilimonas mengyeensis TaxID=1302730 RepID=A0A521C1L0_9BACT|nr:PepSY-associated TM helix domain-containing protein [Gracilimonas mengyeensis]SMO53225.1 Uncharacterized iron-regulated membrane protein [Gracilimonas mengyeensis]
MFKKIILFLHRWLGLISGLVVLVLSISGALFVFQKEFTHWLRKDVMYVEQTQRQRLSMEEMYARTADALEVPALYYGLVTYKDENQAWSAFSYIPNPEPSWTYFGAIKEYKTAYVNPYTGETQAVIDEEKDFFQIMKGIHWSLLLSTPIGQPIVVWSTVIFIVLLISGLVLWWPKKWNKAGKQKSFKVKWGSTWRRVNYDLHNVVGFYALLLALIVGFTGLYWAFPFAKKTLHFLGTGEFKLPDTQTTKVQSTPPAAPRDAAESPLEVAYKNGWEEFPDAYSIAFITPRDSAGTINAIVRGSGKTYYERSEMKFDQYTGEVLQIDAYEDKNAGEKLLAMNYDIHVGAIGGIPGKILALLICIVSGSLPITGFIIWFDKKRRGKRQKSRPSFYKGISGNGRKKKCKPSELAEA